MKGVQRGRAGCHQSNRALCVCSQQCQLNPHAVHPVCSRRTTKKKYKKKQEQQQQEQQLARLFSHAAPVFETLTPQDGGGHRQGIQPAQLLKVNALILVHSQLRHIDGMLWCTLDFCFCFFSPQIENNWTLSSIHHQLCSHTTRTDTRAVPCILLV